MPGLQAFPSLFPSGGVCPPPPLVVVGRGATAPPCSAHWWCGARKNTKQNKNLMQINTFQSGASSQTLTNRYFSTSSLENTKRRIREVKKYWLLHMFLKLLGEQYLLSMVFEGSAGQGRDPYPGSPAALGLESDPTLGAGGPLA